MATPTLAQPESFWPKSGMQRFEVELIADEILLRETLNVEWLKQAENAKGNTSELLALNTRIMDNLRHIMVLNERKFKICREAK